MALFVALSGAAIFPALGANDFKVAIQRLKTVSVVELPAKASQTISLAKADEREAVTVAVIRAVASKHPSALVSVVAAIAKANPDMASVAAASAASLSPKHTEAIALAAAKAAPSAVEKIAASIAKALPGYSLAVADTLANFAPGAARQIYAVAAAASVSESRGMAGKRETSKSVL